jgi:hypothetical protein
MPIASSSITSLRLRNQWIDAPQRGTATDVVDYLVAVQAQDYANSKWGLGLRLRRAVEADIQRAYDKGEILRTHLLRPTWHFVTPRDIRWLLMLTAPRVQALNAGPYRKAGLDAASFKRAHTVIEKSLRGGQYLTREQLRERFEGAGIATSHEFRLSYVMGHAELEGLVCSGPRRGKQLTYALLEERVPPAKRLSREAALKELTRRYFISRAPATVQDFAKWSGLTLADCRAGVESVASLLHKEIINGAEYWLPASSTPRRAGAPSAHLISVFDEYISSYKHHSANATAEAAALLGNFGNAVTLVILFEGQVIGMWKRSFTKDAALITLRPFAPFTPAQRKAVHAAADRYAAFHGVKARIA